ncbi:MAG: hypothetical protein AAF483_19395 [Planctomycetota bacterium]
MKANIWSKPLPLRIAIVALATCIFPLGVIAQDFEAIERRLGGAIEAGELSLEHAMVMMHALHEAAGDHDHDEREDHGERERHFQHVFEEVREAVADGKMSRRQAEEKLRAIHHELFGHEPEVHFGFGDQDHEHGVHEHGDHEHGHHEHGDHKHGDHEHGDHEHGHHEHGDHDSDHEMEAKKQEFMEIREKLNDAVREGELSEEEAKQKLIRMRQEWFGGGERKQGEKEQGARRRRADSAEADMEAKKKRYMAFAQKIGDAVNAGKMSEEDAERQLIEVREKMFGTPKGDDRQNREMEARKQRYLQFAERIKKAVEAGEITDEAAEKQLIEMRERLFGDGKGKAESDEADVRNRRAIAALEEIHRQVAEGKITSEEGRKKATEIRQLMAKASEEQHEHESDDAHHDHSHDDHDHEHGEHDHDDHDHEHDEHDHEHEEGEGGEE